MHKLWNFGIASRLPLHLLDSDSGLAIQKDSKDILQQRAIAVQKLQEAEKKKKMVQIEQKQVLTLKKDITSLNIQFGDYLFANIKHFMKVSLQVPHSYLG